jgi:hypothetical protein
MAALGQLLGGLQIVRGIMAIHMIDEIAEALA